MKTKKLLLGIAVPLFTFLILFGCKKQELQTPEPMDNTPLIKNAVQRSQDQLARTASAKDQSNLKAITADLDYTLAAKLPLGDTAVLYVVHLLSKKPGGTEKFYSVVQKLDDYSFDGIYEAKNIAAIKAVFVANKLPQGDSVLVRGLHGHPTKEWAASADGSLTYKEVRGSSIKDLEKLKQLVSTGGKYKTFLYDGGEPCIYWYYWIYFPGYGWIPVSFLYSTGCDEYETIVGSPQPDDPACSLTGEEVEAALAGAEFSTTSYVMDGSAGGEPETSIDGIIKQDWNSKAHIAEYYPNGMPEYTIKYAAVYAGKRYKDFASFSYWKWYSTPVFIDKYLHEGSMPPCADIQCYIVPINSVISADEKTAKVTFRVQLDINWTCKTGWKVASTNKPGEADVSANQ
jgi:hypothetical protein